MKAATYLAGGMVEIGNLPEPDLPVNGILVQTLACGLCSGELMQWYMDKKAPHVFGHEVSGRVVASDSAEFPVGSLVAPHHHAPCFSCDICQKGHYVHCPTWKRTRLVPGGMSERFAVSAENLRDTHVVNDLDACDAALVEPLACIRKAIRRSRMTPGDRIAVIGAGALGLMHALLLQEAVVFEQQSARLDHAKSLGLDARLSSQDDEFDVIFVCPGLAPAMSFAASIAAPGARIVLFAPLPPQEHMPLEFAEAGYFKDLELIHSYSCGPDDTRAALDDLRQGKVRASQVVSHFVALDELPEAYELMKRSEILKAMVVFPNS